MTQVENGSSPITTQLHQPGTPKKRTYRGSTKYSFTADLIVFGLGNLFFLLFNGALTFMVPRWLSIEEYGYYRMFILYSGFVGVLHLGLVDGALIRWAVRPTQRIFNELVPAFSFLIAQQVLTVCLLILISLLDPSYKRLLWLIIPVGLYGVIWNISLLGQAAMQALKKFGQLSLYTTFGSALLYLATYVLHVAGKLGISVLIGCFVTASLSTTIMIWFSLRSVRKWKSSFLHSLRSAKVHIELGWPILIANFCAVVIMSLDRIAINASLSIGDFALYSFAANALAIVYTIISSISRVVFPYLSDGLSHKSKLLAYEWGETCIVLLWSASLTGYFPIEMAINKYLSSYVSSLKILKILMLGTGLSALVQILHFSFFRSFRQQSRLLTGSCLTLVLSIGFLKIAINVGGLSSVALASVGTVFCWWTVNETMLLKPLARSGTQIFKTAAILCVSSGWFLYCSIKINSHLWAALIYCSGFVVLVLTLYRKSLRAMAGSRQIPFLAEPAEL